MPTRPRPTLLLVLAILLPPLVGTGEPVLAGDLSTPAAIGERLFFDPILSANRNQSCATCHAPEAGFADPRKDGANGAVSLGDDGRSFGDRNAPTASYAAFVPAFALAPATGIARGGLFHDGRASTLEDQAGGPPLNPIEMGMPSKAAVVERLKADETYRAAFETVFGQGALDEPEAGYAAVAKAIAAYERTPVFSPFDSRYDRSLRGEETLTEQEELGRVLFFSSQFTNCSQCHRLKAYGGVEGETFSNYEFHNIGVPVNAAARAANGLPAGTVDHGLLQNPAATDAAGDGRFRVPTLRNVAVTGPYMHNGVFQDLRSVVVFYNKYNLRHPERLKNPETGAAFDPPEVPGTLSLEKLQIGPALKDKEIDAVVAFLKTLTDRRYEPLLARP